LTEKEEFWKKKFQKKMETTLEMVKEMNELLKENNELLKERLAEIEQKYNRILKRMEDRNHQFQPLPVPSKQKESPVQGSLAPANALLLLAKEKSCQKITPCRDPSGKTYSYPETDSKRKSSSDADQNRPSKKEKMEDKPKEARRCTGCRMFIVGNDHSECVKKLKKRKPKQEK